MSVFFDSGGQNIGASASASVYPEVFPGLISFRIDWFGLPAVLGTLKSLLQHSCKASIIPCTAFTVCQIYLNKDLFFFNLF